MKRWALTIAAGPTYAGCRPERRARRRAGGAQDALGRVVVALPILGRLDAARVPARRPSAIRNGMHAAVLGEEVVHVDDEVLDDRQPGQRRDRDLAAQLVDADLAGQPVAAVDQHRVRAAHAVGARAPERQRAVLLPLDACAAGRARGPSAPTRRGSVSQCGFLSRSGSKRRMRRSTCIGSLSRSAAWARTW